MPTTLVIGGTGFIGRHIIQEFHENGYDVTSFSRRDQPPFSEEAIEHIAGDRKDEAVLAAAMDRVKPDIVVDCAVYHPTDVRTALHLVSDVDAYVYVSSGGVYGVQEIPKREDLTPLHECTPDQATDTSMASYGPRKAECDRLVLATGDRGIPAMSVRPSVVYGPLTINGREASTGQRAYDPSWADDDLSGILTHHDYWIHRIARYDDVVVPGDGTAIWHRAYVEDIASAIRIVAERGEPGEAYNVADQRICTLEDIIELIAAALETSVSVVHASRRELDTVGLSPNDFILYHHQQTEYPHILETCKLASLGWSSTPVDVAMARTVDESKASNREGSRFDPGRDTEQQLIKNLTE